MRSSLLTYKGINVHVDRGLRRRGSITVKNGQLYVRCHTLNSDREVMAMLEGKDSWIMKKLNNPINHVGIEFGNSTWMWHLGRKLGVQFVQTSRSSVTVGDTVITIAGPSVKAMQNAYKQFASQQLDLLIDGFRQEINFHGDYQLSYRYYTSRWGCCFAARKEVVLNVWCLALPLEGIKYIYCHELAHLKVSHHQKPFYDELARIWPQYRRGLKITKSYVIS